MSETHHAPGTLCWFECGSTDARKAKEFYTSVFGWGSTDVAMPGEGDSHYTLLQNAGGDVAGLYQLAGPQFEGVPSHWMTYVTVDDVDASAARAAALGGSVFVEPMDVPEVGRMAFITDPTGARIAIFKPGAHAGRTLAPEIANFGWSELHTRDTERASTFYSEWLGWVVRDKSGDPIEYTEFEVAGKSIAGMIAMTPAHGDAPPNWLPYVMVEDCDASAAKITESGGAMIVQPTTIPDVGRFCVFADPTGGVLAIIKLEHH